MLLVLHTDISGGRSGDLVFPYVSEFSSLLWFTQSKALLSQWSRSKWFLEFPCFSYDPTDVGSLKSGSSVFSKSNLNIWQLSVHILLKPPWRILSIILLACEMSAIVRQFEHSSALPIYGIGMKTDLFHSCGHSWVI